MWGVGVTDILSGYEVMLPLNIFKIKVFFILIRLIMTQGKYKTS